MQNSAASASVIVLLAPAADPSALEALTLDDARNVPHSPEIVRRTFTNVALALGWAYANAPTMPAGLLELDVRPSAPAVFKRPAHAHAPQADAIDDLLNGGPDYATAA
jgi:hypothetical protein